MFLRSIPTIIHWIADLLIALMRLAIILLVIFIIYSVCFTF